MNELRTIKFSKKRMFYLLRGNIITRHAIGTDPNFITMDNVPYRLANRIFKLTDIEVKVKDEWVFVQNNDFEALKKVYEPLEQLYGLPVKEEKKEEVQPEPEPVVEKVEEPVVEVSEPIAEEMPVEEEKNNHFYKKKKH